MYQVKEDGAVAMNQHYPGKAKDPSRTKDDNRRFVDAVLWVLRTGAPWRDLPKRFGPGKSLCNSVRRSVNSTALW
jgi:transposase